MARVRIALIWVVLALVVAVPIAAAAMSPLLQWRSPVYIVAGFAGVAAMVLMLFQPLLAAGYLAGISIPQGRRVHRLVGKALLLAIIIHLVGLWITSPPDVIDALLFASPTKFSPWGVVAMWGVFATASLAAFRRRLRPRLWRLSHKTMAAVIVVGSVVHAMLIDGTMETFSKAALCAPVVIATALALMNFRFRSQLPANKSNPK